MVAVTDTIIGLERYEVGRGGKIVSAFSDKNCSTSRITDLGVDSGGGGLWIICPLSKEVRRVI